MIVSILLASLRQLGQTQHVRAVWTGVVLAVLAAALGGALIFFTVREYNDTTFQTVFETITYLIAVVLLTTMTFWMQAHSRTLKRDITAKAGAASSGFALGLLAFTTVGREGLESAVFTLAFAFQTNGVLLLSGALAGIAAAVGLCVLIYRVGYRLDYRLFFRVMGVLLLVFAAGLLGDAIQNLQELGWLHLGTATLWNSSAMLPEDSALGDLLHAFFGYAQAPTLLQSALYLVFLAIAGTAFWRVTRKAPPSHSPSNTQTPSVAPRSA